MLTCLSPDAILSIPAASGIISLTSCCVRGCSKSLDGKREGRLQSRKREGRLQAYRKREGRLQSYRKRNVRYFVGTSCDSLNAV